MNKELRQHVTRVGFDLQLGKTHIAALVFLEELRKVGWETTKLRRTGNANGIQRAFNHWVTGARGLVERGLADRNPEKKPAKGYTDESGWHFVWEADAWKVTKAGKLVIKLLEEAGIYEEYAREIRMDPRTGKEIADDAGVVVEEVANG